MVRAALTDQVLDRVPFAQNVVTWFGTDLSLEKLAGAGSDNAIWSTSWGKIEIGPGGARPVEGSFMDRWGGKLEAGYFSGSRLIGTYELTDPGIARKGVFVWYFTDQEGETGGSPAYFTGHRFQQAPPQVDAGPLVG